MRKTILIRGLSLLALLALVPVIWTQENDADAVPEGVEVLARGPVHEAFAEPGTGKTQPSPVVPKQPPDLIEEMPPDEKPEGDVQWLPGYWAWDEERNDYIWVSGFWRVPPPGRRWVPGHWKQAVGGWQWVPGFWAGEQQRDMTYLPPPPESMDAGPSVPAPTADHIYVPGCWVYQGTRYAWRPGFWCAPRPGWVWVPSHYVWTPGGYIYVEGYWDYTLRDRGLLFAPAYINVAVVHRPGWCYTPTYVIHDDCLVGALFVRRGYGCYYFGDYFEPCYRTSGFVAFHEVSIGGRHCDPLFSYYSFHYRSNPGWAISLRIGYNDCYRGLRPRPPRTLIQQNTVVNKTVINKTVVKNTVNNITVNNNNGGGGDPPAMLSPLKHASKKGVALKKLPPEHRKAERDSAKELTRVAYQRSQLETPDPGGRGPDRPRVMKMDLPKGPPRQAKASPPSLEGKARQGPGKATDGPGKGPNGPGKGPNFPGRANDGPGRGPNGPGKANDGPGRGPNGPGRANDGPGKGPNGPGKGPDGPGKAKDGPGKGPMGPGKASPGPARPGFPPANVQPRLQNPQLQPKPPANGQPQFQNPQLQPRPPAAPPPGAFRAPSNPPPRVSRPPERREEKKDDRKKR